MVGPAVVSPAVVSPAGTGGGPTPSPRPTRRCPDAPEEGQYTRDGYDISWIVYELVPCDREILSGSGGKNDGDTKGSLGVQEYWSYRDGQWKRDGFWGGVTETTTTGDPRFDHDIETKSWRSTRTGRPWSPARWTATSRRATTRARGASTPRTSPSGTAGERSSASPAGPTPTRTGGTRRPEVTGRAPSSARTGAADRRATTT